MKQLLLLLLFAPLWMYGQKEVGEYAYVKYTNEDGYRDYEVVIQFSADSVLNYSDMKNEKRIFSSKIVAHSFEVIAYMQSLHYSPISISLMGKDVYLLMLFKKDKP